jgi:predicted RNase H-like HicB family nuclease
MPGVHAVDCGPVGVLGRKILTYCPTAARTILWLEDLGMNFEIERENDGRWTAEVPDPPGVMVYGGTREEALAKVEVLALLVIADGSDHGEPMPELDELFAVSA